MGLINYIKKPWVVFAIILALSTYAVYGQQYPRLEVSQNVKLAIIGGDNGNSAFTTNINARLSLEGFKNAYGSYLAGIAEYEYADLNGGKYNRWSLGIASALKLNDRSKWTVRPSAQFGFIERTGTTMTGVFNVDILFDLGKGWSILQSNSWTIRTDLENTPWRYSNKLGISKQLDL